MTALPQSVPSRRQRPATPVLDAWRGAIVKRYGPNPPASAWVSEVGTPAWVGAAGEAYALQAHFEGDLPESVARLMRRPYELYAEALTDRDYRHRATLAPDELKLLDAVKRCRGLAELRANVRFAVLRLAERERVDLNHYRDVGSRTRRRRPVPATT